MNHFKIYPELTQVNKQDYFEFLNSGYSEYCGPLSTELVRDLPKPIVYFDDNTHVLIRPGDENYLEIFMRQKENFYLLSKSNSSMIQVVVNQTIYDMIIFFGFIFINNPNNFDLISVYKEDWSFITANYERFANGDKEEANYLPTSVFDLSNDPIYGCSLIDKEDFRIVNLFSAAMILNKKGIPFQKDPNGRNFLVKQTDIKIAQNEWFNREFKLAEQYTLGLLLSNEIGTWRQEMADEHDDYLDPKIASAYNESIESSLLKND